jgi:5-amino-6-(5-phosphoribosylamino)uracil reductase
MRQLLPFPCDLLTGRTVAICRRPGRAAVRLNMTAGTDVATAVAGVSGGLGGPADQALFAVLRSQADVVLVAAGTVRAEHYGPLGVPVAVLSRSCRLDWDSPFFTAAITPPIVVTVAEAPALERKRPPTSPT